MRADNLAHGGATVMARKKGAPGLVEQLKQAIRDSGKTLMQLSEESGVDTGRLSRFLRGKRNINILAAEKICDALGLGLAPVQRRRKGGGLG
jgi:transcriptional regulator with XRE-family HTH domain